MGKQIFIECQTNIGISFLIDNQMVMACPTLLPVSEETAGNIKAHPFVDILKVYEEEIVEVKAEEAVQAVAKESVQAETAQKSSKKAKE